MNEISNEQPIDFHNRNTWRGWLQANHGRDAGIWVLIRKVGSEGGGVLYKDAVEEALCFGWIDGKMKSIDAEAFMLWFSPRRRASNWSELNRRRANSLIEAGLMTSAGLAAIDKAKKSGKWQAEADGTRFSLPKELEEALKEHGEAWENFSNFAAGYRKTYCGWILDAKRQETRLRRIAVVVSRSAENKKPGVDM